MFGGEESGDPSPVRARPLRDRSLNSPSQQKPQGLCGARHNPGFRNAFRHAASPPRLCPLLSITDSESVFPMAIHLFRSSLRSAAAQMNRYQGSAPLPTMHELCRLKSSRLVLLTSSPEIWQPALSLHRLNRGGFDAGYVGVVLLALARPRSARAGKGEGKGACLPASLLPAYGLQDARPMKVVLTRVSYIICVRCQNVQHLLTAKSLAVSLAMDTAAFTRSHLWPISASRTFRLVSPLEPVSGFLDGHEVLHTQRIECWTHRAVHEPSVPLYEACLRVDHEAAVQ